MRISVIVPVYKTELYLRKCVDSILRQTYSDIECILVDDGSPDNCGEICNEYAKKDKRVRVIHKKNGGLSDARNAGIEASTGDYLMFVDSDDYIELEMAEKMLTALRENEADCSVCGIGFVKNDTILPTTDSLEAMTLNNIETLRLLGKEKNYCNLTSMANKLFSRYLFDKIKFPYGKLHEDQFIIHKIYYQCKRITFIPDILYHAVYRNESITHSTVSVKRLDDIEAVYSRALFYEKNGLYELLPQTAELIARINLWLRPYINDNTDFAKARIIETKKMSRSIYYRYAPKKELKCILGIESPSIYRFLKRVKTSAKQFLDHS